MTAFFFIEDHADLTNIGQLSHSAIDTYITGSTFLVVSGASGPLPPSARRLKAGTNITFIDEGPGNNFVINSTAVASSNGLVSWMEVPSGSVDGINVTFTLANTPSPSTGLMFFVNGVLQKQGIGNDYLIAGSLITSNFTIRSGSNIAATYPYVSTGSLSISWMEIPSGAVNGVNTTFILANTPASTPMFFVNGVLQKQGIGNDYILTGNTIVTNYVIQTGSNIAITYPY